MIVDETVADKLKDYAREAALGGRAAEAVYGGDLLMGKEWRVTPEEIEQKRQAEINYRNQQFDSYLQEASTLLLRAGQMAQSKPLGAKLLDLQNRLNRIQIDVRKGKF